MADTTGFNRATVKRLAVAVAAGVGVLGSVTLLGAIVTSISLYYASMPIETALAAKSKTELLTVGAARLVPFAVVTASIALVFFFAHGRSNHWPSHAGPAPVTPATPETPATPAGPTPEISAIERLRTLEDRDVLPGVLLVLAALLVMGWMFRADGSDPWYAWDWAFWTKWTFWFLVVLAIVAVSIAYYVGAFFQSFDWLLVALTVAIAVFGSVVSIVRTVQTPKMQAFALLRKGEDEGLRGFYIAETSSFVHIGLVSTCGKQRNEKKPKSGTNAKSGTKPKKGSELKHGTRPKNARIVVVPRSEVVAFSIGPKQPLCEAWANSGKRLRELRATRADRSLRLPGDARQFADGSISVHVNDVTLPDRLIVADVAYVRVQDPGTEGDGSANILNVRQKNPGTGIPFRLAVRITDTRGFVVHKARVFIDPFAPGLFKPQPKKAVLTDPHGVAHVTLKLVEERSGAVPSQLVLYVRALPPKPPKPKPEEKPKSPVNQAFSPLASVSARRLVRVPFDPKLSAEETARKLKRKLGTSYGYTCTSEENDGPISGLGDLDYVCQAEKPKKPGAPKRPGYWVGTDGVNITGMQSTG